MKIELMQENHIPSVAKIAAASLPESWSEQAFADELANPTATVFVALSDDEVIGFGGVQIVLDEAYITNVAVDKDFRKNGVGSKLLEAIINHCKNEKCSFVSLEVRVSNTAAINLYKKHGFASQGIRKNFYSHPTEDADIMTLFLKD